MSLLNTPRSRTATIAACTFAVIVTVFCPILLHDHLYPKQAGIAVADYFADPYRVAAASASPGATPVLVELFTSEGCSSCPPADALLAGFQRTQPIPHASIIALEEHVDYWDSLGWKDRFSSHQLTVRQSAYAQRLRREDVFTPQMIVDGTDQFVGSDGAHAERAIVQAALAPKLVLSISHPTLINGHIAAIATLAQPPSSVPDADIFAALIQPMASTQVLDGENSGRTLQHVAVVRSLQRIGSLTRLATSPLNFSLDLPKDVNSPRIVVFIQRSGQGAVLGAATSDASATPAPSTSIAAVH